MPKANDQFNPASLARVTTKARRQQEKEAEQERQERYATFDQCVRKTAANYRREIREQAAEAASQGRAGFEIRASNLGERHGSRSPNGISYYEVEREALHKVAAWCKRQGFGIEIRSGHYSPIGSDDMPSHDYTNLTVTWDSAIKRPPTPKPKPRKRPVAKRASVIIKGR